MGTEFEKTVMSWEIDNLWKRNNNWIDKLWNGNNNLISLDPFSSGGCKWYVTVRAEKHGGDDRLFLYLKVVDPSSLRPGWKRRAIFSHVLLNQSGQELCKSKDICQVFCAEASSWGFHHGTKLQHEGFRDKTKLTIQVSIKVLEVVHQGKSTANDVMYFSNFEMIASQSAAVFKIFKEHPYAIPNQAVKTAHMHLLLGLVDTLGKSPLSLSVTEESRAESELTELTETGFKLDWLKSKLEEVSLERKKALSDVSLVQQLEERVKNVELTLCDLRVELDKEKMRSAKVSSFELMDFFFIKRFFLSCFSLSKH